MSTIIGIHGKAHSGKDSLAKLIIEESAKIYTEPFVRYGFADPIKNACNLIFGWDERHAFGDLKEIVDPYWGFSPRLAYQTLGTEWGRNCLREDLWMKVAEKFIKDHPYVVIPDVRFNNEVEFIKANSGIIVHITRNVESIELSAHASEAGLSQKYLEDAMTLVNDGPFEHLRTVAIVLAGLNRPSRENAKKVVKSVPKYKHVQ